MRAPGAVARVSFARVALGLLLAFGALALAGCGGDDTRPPPKTYVVKAGDTLYSIAWRHRLDYREVARWNRIGSDYRIEVGQVLRLTPPSGAARVATAPAGNRAGKPAARTPAPRPPVSAAPAPPAQPARLPDTVRWNWPTEARSIGPVQQPAGGVGLRLAGTEGQEIRAAAAGKVVYTGAGLRAYGQLVIVRHDEFYLSAYGHNREVHVQEGQTVRAGQKIASMGRGPGDAPMLYFEIRLNGTPVDPRRLLPKR